MQILKTLEKITEAAARQGIVIDNILDDGTVISESPAYTRKYKLKEVYASPEHAVRVNAYDLDSGDHEKLVKRLTDEYGHSFVDTNPDGGILVDVPDGNVEGILDTVNSIIMDMGLEESCKVEEANKESNNQDENKLGEADEDEDESEEEYELELDDEESHVDYDSKDDAASGILDNIIMGNFEDAHDALEDYRKMYLSDEDGDGIPDELEDDAKMDAEMADIDDDSMMPAKEGEELEEGAAVTKNGWNLVDKAGKLVYVGDTVKGRKGDATIKSGTPPHKPSSTGRVYTDEGEYFPTVYNLKWVKEEK